MKGITKIDPQLMIATQLSATELERSSEAAIGFEPKNKTWRLIIKYGGDINRLVKKYNAVADILTETYAIVTIGEELIGRFSNEMEVEYIEKPKGLGYQVETGLWDACIEPVNDYPAYALKGDGVLIGIIDSGIDYSHPDFRTQDGKTRILRMWDQSGQGNPPEGFHHGREYKEAEINQILQDHSYSMVLPGGDFSGHGTLVSGVAAGNGNGSNGSFCGVAPNASLLIVKLGATDYDGYPIKTVDVMYGVNYLLAVAQSMNMPIAINLSYGSGYGSRDGQGLFENYLNDMALHWKNVIVTGSGNDAAKRAHISGQINTDHAISFSINGYTTNASLEIWKSSSDDFNLEILYPGGGSTGIIPELQQVLRYGYRNEFVMIYTSPPTPLNVNDSIHIEIITTLDYLEEGIWTIFLHPKTVLIGEYDAWLHGNESCTMMNPNQENTLTLPGTAENIITVAAYNHLTGNIAGFSGQGSAKMHPVKPDIAAPGVDIMSTALNGMYQSATGTSIAAPFVTGACALMMQWGIVNRHDPYLYGNKIKASLYQGCVRDKHMPYPNSTWGYGKLCLQNVMDILMANEVEPVASLTQMDSKSASGENQVTHIEQLIRSNDYVDIIAEKNDAAEAYAKENNGIIIGHRLAENEVILHIKRSIFRSVVNDLDIIISSSCPTLFGLLDVYSVNSSNIFAVNNHPSLGLKGRGVLVGFIDTGIDYTHPCFFDANGNTRIKAIWDQSILTGSPPEGFSYGTEYSEEQINQALRDQNPFSIVPTKDEDGHGTFLAGVACSSESGQYIGVAPESQILCVKLAAAKKHARESSMLFDEKPIAYQSTDILTGLRYLTDKAKELDMPIAILLAIGSAQGPHTGLSLVHAANYKNGVAVVSACGNEGSTLHHANGVLLKSKDTKEIQINIAEGEQGIEIFIWNFSPDKLSIGLISPSGEVIERIPIRNTLKHDMKLVLHDTDIWVNYYLSLGAMGDQMTLIRFRNPEPGLWTLIIYGDEIIDGRYDAYLPLRNWIKPDTYFIDADSSCTVTVFDNALEVISVGAYNHTNHHLFVDSGKGPTRIGIMRPDLIAPGVNISGPLPGYSYGHKSGTSVAAAHVAGAAALLLEWGVVEGNQRNMDTRSIRALLIAGARRTSGVKYPNNQSGYGELDLLNTFEEINLNLTLDLRGTFLLDFDE